MFHREKFNKVSSDVMKKRVKVWDKLQDVLESVRQIDNNLRVLKYDQF